MLTSELLHDATYVCQLSEPAYGGFISIHLLSNSQTVVSHHLRRVHHLITDEKSNPEAGCCDLYIAHLCP